MTRPVIDDPRFPDGYVPERTGRHVEWDTAVVWLTEACHYWLATTRPDGTPHVVPRWGVWWDGRFWYDGAPDTRHARNLAGNPACALHLESGEQVLILEGEARPTGALDIETGRALAEEYARKYAPAYSPPPDAWSGPGGGGMILFTPKRGFAWSRFPDDVTRYTWL
jgi:hypothetical protein